MSRPFNDTRKSRSRSGASSSIFPSAAIHSLQPALQAPAAPFARKKSIGCQWLGKVVIGTFGRTESGAAAAAAAQQDSATHARMRWCKALIWGRPAIAPTLRGCEFRRHPFGASARAGTTERIRGRQLARVACFLQSLQRLRQSIRGKLGCAAASLSQMDRSDDVDAVAYCRRLKKSERGRCVSSLEPAGFERVDLRYGRRLRER